MLQFLIYILIFAILAAQVILLVRHPSSRSPARVGLTVGLVVVCAVIVMYGILN